MQKQIGQTGVPVYNVSNACATGATALRTAIMAIKAGEAEYGLAVGVEKLSGAGLLSGGSRTSDSNTWAPKGRYGAVASVDGRIGTDTMPGVFAQIGMEYGHKYGGTSFELFARISEKNHAHSTLNPLAAYTKRMTLDEIMNDLMIAYPNTRPMCSANCDGAAAAVVVSESTLRTLSGEQQRRAVKVSASVLTSDPWQESCQILPDVNTLTKNAAKQAYEQLLERQPVLVCLGELLLEGFADLLEVQVLEQLVEVFIHRRSPRRPFPAFARQAVGSSQWRSGGGSAARRGPGHRVRTPPRGAARSAAARAGSHTAS